MSLSPPPPPSQIVVGSDDDRCPTLQVWDLRSGSSPIKEFVGHHKGRLKLYYPIYLIYAYACMLSLSYLRSSVRFSWGEKRNFKHGLKTFHVRKGHDSPLSGVTAMDWCPHDPALFLSTGKDSRVICWVRTRQVVSISPTILFPTYKR